MLKEVKNIKIFNTILAMIGVIEPLKNFTTYILKKIKKNKNYCYLKKEKRVTYYLLLVIVCKQ